MKILYATDGLKAARDAGALLTKVGDRDRLDITVLSVCTFEIAIPERASLVLDSLDERRKRALDVSDSAVERLIEAGFNASTKTAEGSPGQQIVKAVEDDWYDLTVVGAGSRSWLGHLLLGSTSTFVLHNSASSVLVVHEAPIPGEESRILVGVDGSRGSEFATRAVQDLADPDRVNISIASVVEPTPPAGAPVLGRGDAAGHRMKLDERLSQHARERVDRIVSRLDQAGFRADGEVLGGPPTGTLLKECESGEYDFVAVGSRGLGPFRRTLLGSVSDQIARYARAALVARRLIT